MNADERRWNQRALNHPEMAKTATMWLLIAMVSMILIGCEGDVQADEDAPANKRPTIVATTGMIGDVAQNIAGESADVYVLMGPGVDPHLYRPTRSDVRRMLAADLVLYNGLNLEGKMTEALEQIARAGGRSIAVAEEIDQDYLMSPAEFEGEFDPHIWMDPRGWMKASNAIADALIDLQPELADTSRERLARYLAELESLDTWARDVIETIPTEKRLLVTAHDAFGYFARAYNVQVEAIQGISTDSEPGLRHIEGLVELIVNRRISAVFTESSVSDKNIRAIIEGARSRGHDVALGGELFSDAMGAEGSPEGTYIGMIEHNVRTIAEALGGTPLPRERGSVTALSAGDA